MSQPSRAAGRGGGLLFVALVCFLAYLTVTTVEGAAGVIAAAVLVAAAAALLANVARRR